MPVTLAKLKKETAHSLVKEGITWRCTKCLGQTSCKKLRAWLMENRACQQPMMPASSSGPA
eukprot:15122402-Alexandrium_andersonii.AAC.1